MKQALVDWILKITESQERLSGLPICPYAKQAYVSKTYSIGETNYDTIEADIESSDLQTYQVSILYYLDYQKHPTAELVNRTRELNSIYNKRDIVILDNDPREPLILNGVQTTFDACYLWILQPLMDLNEKSQMLKKTKYYSYWTPEQLAEVVTWRFHTDN